MAIWRSPMSLGDLNQWRAIPLFVGDLSQVVLNTFLLHDYPAEFGGRVIGLRWVTGTAPASTAGKDIDLAVLIGGVQVTGGLLTLLTASIDTIGDVVVSTAVTALDSFVAGDLLSVKCVEATAAFVQGNGTLELVVGES